MDLSLSAEHAALRSAFRTWVEHVVAPMAISNDREERFPAEALDGLRKTGYIGLTIPDVYGGGGADPLSYVLLIEELGRGDANVRSIVSVHLGLVAGSIARWGSDAQKERWLPQMAGGDVLGCFALTEPDYGSNPADLAARAEALPGAAGWRLTGRKVFITNGSIAGVALVMARTGGSGAGGVSAFLVPTDAAGFESRPIHGKLGLRSCDTAELVLDGVVVGPDALLGPEGAGLKVALRALDDGRMSIAASSVGIAQAALDAMTSYGTQRVQFGKPIAAHQLVQELIADTAVDVAAARLLTWACADQATRGVDFRLAASTAKLFATEAAVRAANNCVQVHGGYGYIDEYVAGKLLRDARVATLYEGTSQIQKLLIGRALTGISAF